MPPEGRRKKKFEKEMRRVQNRNLFAALVLLIAAVATVFLIRWLLLSTKPVLFVLINRVDHSGTREIPFSEDSCDVITSAFQSQLICKTGDIQQLDEKNSRLNLDPSISNQDVLIVYLNGHLIEKFGDDGREVYWIGPESDSVNAKKLSDLLLSADESDAKLKIVLLDAGRYTWSPVFPGREPNQFQSVLADKLEKDEWNLGDDFWVITSHSDYEISNVSTPLKTSLFAKSVAESLKSPALRKSEEIQVPQLFAEINKRTQSYSRNFNNKSLQNPVLMHAGVGVVKSPLATVSRPESEILRVTWVKQASSEESNTTEKPSARKFPLSEFAQDPESFSAWFYQPEIYSSLPNQTIRSLERFLEFDDESKDWPTSDQDKIEVYTQELTRTSRRSPGPQTNFDPKKLEKKRTNIEAFRRAVLEFSVMIRLRNQMLFWDDNTYESITGPGLPTRLAEPVKLNDDILTDLATPPPSIKDWLQEWEDFKKGNEKSLFEKIDLQLGRDEELSPLQAELLGVVSQRYLMLLKSKPDVDEPEKKNPVPGDLQITLEVDVKGRFNPGQRPVESDPGAGFKSVVLESIEELGKLRAVDWAGESDTAMRYQLAAIGSEFTEAKTGVVPNVAWSVIPKKIDIKAISSTEIHEVNPYDKIPVQFKIDTTVVDNIDLKITTIGAELDGLNYGFTQGFLKTELLTDLDAANDANQETKTVDVFFQYPQIVADNIGKPFGFSITATDRSDPTVVDKVEFRIRISDEPTFWLSSKRKLADWSEGQQAKLFHWGDAPAEGKWAPLAIRTLANVKSGFEFNFQNNSDMPRSFDVKLFNIKKFPNEIDGEALRADRDDSTQVRNFAQWLKSQNVKSNEFFELIGQSSVKELKPQETTPVVFSLPPPNDPEEKLDPNAGVTYEIGSGALVVFYDANQPDDPAWFQMLKFETQDSANVSTAISDQLKVKDQIENVFRDDIAKLKDNLVFSPKEVSPARLTTVSKSVLGNNRDGDVEMNLDDILAKSGFSPDTEQALLLLDVLGVSNYATYEINGSTIERTSLRQHLTGIRVIHKNSPEGWRYNPASWSFARAQQLASPYQWLATSGPDGVTDFFIDTSAEQDPAVGGKKELTIEVFLPFKNIDTLSWKEDDFWYRAWRTGKMILHYPNSRRHFVEISSRGMAAWSKIRSHQIKITDPEDRVLEIGQGTETLGKWRFVTESRKFKPAIDATPKKAEASLADLKRVLIDVDIRDVKPAVVLSQITLNLNGKPVKDLAVFLKKHPHPGGSGQYQFSLFDIFSEFGEPLKQEKTDMEIEVLVTDFFGHSTSDRTSVAVVPKPVIKPPPKPVTVVVKLELNGDPAKLYNFSDVTINKKTIRLDRATAFNDGQVKLIGDKAASTLTIEGLIPGVYDVVVSALVYPKNEAIAVPAIAKGKIKVAEGEPAMTLKFTQ